MTELADVLALAKFDHYATIEQRLQFIRLIAQIAKFCTGYSFHPRVPRSEGRPVSGSRVEWQGGCDCYRRRSPQSVGSKWLTYVKGLEHQR
jgi:hypothetical protein